MTEEYLSVKLIDAAAEKALDALGKNLNQIHEHGLAVGMLVEHFYQALLTTCTEEQAGQIVVQWLEQGRGLYKAIRLGQKVKGIEFSDVKPLTKGGIN